MSGDLRSTPVSQRIAIIDIWRGFALLGVVVVNFCSRNQEFLTADASTILPTSGLDWKVNLLVAFLMANKFHTLFSFLFGVGFAIIIERAGQGSFDPDRLLLRRMLILLAIGWLHFLLLFSGEEVHVYAVCGLVLLACRRMSNTLLLTAGIALALIPRLILEEWPFFQRVFGLRALPDAWFYSGLDSPDARFAVLDESAPAGFLSVNFGIAMHNLSAWPTSGAYFLYFLGRIFIGFVAWRSGWLRAFVMIPTQRLRKWVIFTGIASALITLAGLSDWPGERGSSSHLAYNALRQLGFFVVVGFYVCGLTWLHRSHAVARMLAPLASLGRMSLTAYLSQSLFIMLLLAGPGLMLAGHIGPSVAALMALGVYVMQLVLSRMWSRHFEHGPVEWLWRWLTYSKLKP